MKKTVFFVISLCISIVASAQWVKPDVNYISKEDAITAEYVYLYNVDYGAFLTGGNYWGTRACVGYNGQNNSDNNVSFDDICQGSAIINGYKWKVSESEETLEGGGVCYNFANKTTSNYLTADGWDGVWVDGGDARPFDLWIITSLENNTFELTYHNMNGKFGLSEYAWGATGNTNTYFLDATQTYDAGTVFSGTAYTTWAFVSAGEYERVQPLLNVYYHAIGLKQKIDETKEAYPTIDLSVAEAIYANTASTDEEVSAAIAAINDAIDAYKSSMATFDDPIDMTSRIGDGSDVSPWTREFTGTGQVGTWHTNTWSTEADNGGDGTDMTTPFCEDWVGSGSILSDQKIYQVLKDAAPGLYKFTADVRLYNEAGNVDALTGATMYFGEETVTLEEQVEMYKSGSKCVLWSKNYFNIIAIVAEGGDIEFGFNIKDATFNWMAFKKTSLTYYGNENVEANAMKLYMGSEIEEIILSQDKTLESTLRYPSTTQMTINEGIKFVIEGTASMTLATLNVDMNLQSDSYAQIFSATSTITVTGDLSERIYTQGMTWNFLSLPFDCDLSRMTTENGSAYAIRYYDGASRAAKNAAQDNWKNYGKRDIIPMGTGFIYMTEHDAWTRFYAVDNENKAHVFQATSGETTLGLERHEAASAKNSGWNLVGNPYANYYSIQSMDFDKAVTVWNGASYDAVFPSDDDLALKPGQAFFVQCPSGVESITMPGSGRQLTAEVTGGAKARSASARDTRRLINLSLTDSQFTDKTRVVLNEEASMGYELEHDAGKFMSMRTEVPQLYSLGTDGTKYAINERPMDDGTVKLGLYIPADGDYTLTITRNDAEQILLTDSETGQTVDLTEGSYRFYAKKGTYNNRLMLTFGTVTGMDDVRWSMYDVPGEGAYYDLSGRRIGKPTKAGVYLLKNGKRVQKVWVK